VRLALGHFCLLLFFLHHYGTLIPIDTICSCWSTISPDRENAIDVAKHADLKRHLKSGRSPKKKPLLHTGYRNDGHASTAKILGITSTPTP